MSTRPLKQTLSKLAVRFGAALLTSMVIQRGRMRALLREAQHRGASYLQSPGEETTSDESAE